MQDRVRQAEYREFDRSSAGHVSISGGHRPRTPGCEWTPDEPDSANGDQAADDEIDQVMAAHRYR
jgi:hypothetical protein